MHLTYRTIMCILIISVVIVYSKKLSNNILAVHVVILVVTAGVMAVNSSGVKIEFHFISSCAPAKSSAVVGDDEQLLINLRECHDINRPSEYKTWANKLITPLRDRLVYHII